MTMKTTSKTKAQLLNEISRLKRQNDKLNSTVENLKKKTDKKKSVKKDSIELKDLNWILDQIPHAVCLIDSRKKFLFVNKNYSKVTGIPKSQLVGKSLKDSLPSKLYKEEKKRITAFLKGERKAFYNVELEISKRPITVNIKYIPISKKEDNSRNFLVIMENITKTKKIEISLQDSEEKYRILLENSLEGIGISKGNQVIYANPALLKIFRYESLKEFKRIPLLDHVAPESRENIRKRMKDRRKGKELPPRFEYKILTKDGEIRDLEISTSEIGIYTELYIQSTFRDITDRKKAEELLKKNEEKWRNIIQNAPGTITILGHDGSIKYINKTLSGAETKSVYKKKLLDFIDPEFQDTVKKALARVFKHKSKESYEQSSISLTGKKIWVSTNLSPLLKDGKVISALAISTDITERRNTEEKLEFLSSIVEQSRDSIICTNQNYKINYINDASVKLFGYSREEFIGNTPDFLNAEPLADGIQKKIYETVATGKTYSGQVWNIKKSREKFICQFKITPLHDKKGNISGYIGSQQDITEQVKMKESLEKKVIQLDSFINNIPDMAWLKDINSEYIAVNRAFGETIGISPENLVNKSLEKCFGKKTAARIIEEDLKVIESKKQLRFEEEMENAKGETITLESIKSPIIDDQGRVIGTVGVSRDITARKWVEAELRAAKEKAEESDNLKSAFLATISHEVRTPVNAINGFADLLLKDQLTKQQAKFAGIIKQSGESLLALISDVLDYSVIEAGKIPINKAPFSLKNLIKEIEIGLRLIIAQEKKKINFSKNISDKISQNINGDYQKLKQIINNLINNAVKFTDEGEITLQAELNKKNQLVFSISDTGRGIILSDPNLLFEPFRQEEVGYTRKYRGTGLGLTISKKLVELMKGDIHLKSKTGEKHGTTIMFTLPYEPVLHPIEKMKQEIKVNPSGQNKKILVVEDDEFNFEYIREVLENAGYLVESAGDGNQAISKYNSDSEISLILMDLRMPFKDGFDAAKEIRKIEKKEMKTKIPIIALSAAVTEQEKTKSIESGCNHFLIKPIPKDQLLDAVAQFI
jgi:PAS domain S-box-containing protein